MTAKRLAQNMLAEINAAISAINNGAQSATVSTGNGSKSYTRASLADLMKLRASLIAQIAAYKNGGRPKITITGASFG